MDKDVEYDEKDILGGIVGNNFELCAPNCMYS